jgi:adenine-specific DNA methylase
VELARAADAITVAAHEALGGVAGTRPLVVDPFSGGGAIPLEALRVGADVFASDLNPVAVLITKVAVEYLPRFGESLANDLRTWGDWIRRRSEETLRSYFPRDEDGAEPIAYLWARVVRCEGPDCGTEVPLVRSLWLARNGDRSVALKLVPQRSDRRVDFELIQRACGSAVQSGTVARGAVLCPCCGFTTPVRSVRAQLKAKRGGSADARLLAVVTLRSGHTGRFYRLPTGRDINAVEAASRALALARDSNELVPIPDEPISLDEIRRISVPLYGMSTWGDLYTPRQALVLSTFARLVRDAPIGGDASREEAIRTLLAFALDKQADLGNALCRWESIAQCPRQLFGRQAIGMVWDFAEGVALGDSSGSWSVQIDRAVATIQQLRPRWRSGTVVRASAMHHPLPDDCASALFTDPPYYDAVPYAHLSDFFYVWLRRSLGQSHSALLHDTVVDKSEEIVVDRPHQLSSSNKDIAFYERSLGLSLAEGRRVVRPDGIATIVFASKTTASWEAVLRAIIDAGWVITASWPIDTENASRMNAMGTASLASSVHIVCRPREHVDGTIRHDEVGDWSSVLSALKKRIHDWLPRLSAEGVVGADAIFACLGPALEEFSRFSRVERASGERVLLSDYLEQVWAVVSQEALSSLFRDADAFGLEPDARLTSMWLWTLKPGASTDGDNDEDVRAETGEEEEEEETPKDGARPRLGFHLEFDAARKIAQGLGARIEELGHVVEVKGDRARLLAVVERTKYLFEKQEGMPTAKKGTKKKQMTFFGELDDAVEARGWGEVGAPKAGSTTLDRVHQATLLFGSGRSEALKRFLVDEGVGKQPQFWKLAQSLSALYPNGSDEKRWVDGVLARKKGLGFG